MAKATGNLAVLGAALLASLPLAAQGTVSVQVDASTRHQTMVGYGATTLSLAFGDVDNVPYPLRLQAIDAIYNQVKLNMGNLEPGPFESPANALYSPANDNGDPSAFNGAGFNWTQSDHLKSLVVDLGAPFGFDSFYLGPAISEGYEFAWALSLRSSNYSAYLDECAEHVAALALHWRDVYGINPPLLQLWNEPIGGNGEVPGGTPQELTDVVKRAGARLRQEGLNTLFVVPADETEQRSLDEATAILSDPDAAQYVGAVAYHPYPYGSTYASVPNILATSGQGTPDAAKVQLRHQLRDLGAAHGIPVFMVEVSHSNLTFRDFDGLRGRAIQIHDELTYADAAAFFGMNAMWDSVTNDQHYQGRSNPGLFSETDTIALIDDADGGTNQVYISEMGYAIGHYARWVPKGSVRLDATSDDPMVQVTAFRDDRDGRLAVVLINNGAQPKALQVSVSGLVLDGAAQVTGEQSTAGSYWLALSAFAPSASGYAITLPARSVTSLGAPLNGSATNTAPLVSAGTAQTLTLPAQATLRGTASDDGLPNPPGQLTISWSQVSGPGTVTFGNAQALQTTATFSAAGVYGLRLTASDGVLSAARDVSITVLAAGTATPPIAWWRFDEGAGTVAADATGNGHTGTVTGPPTWTVGHAGGALQFNGANGYVAVADFNPPVSLTLEAWIDPQDNTGTDSIILDKHNSEYDLRIDGTGKLSASAGGTSLAASASNLYASGSAGVWHHVAYAFDGVAHTHALYLDGQQVASGANAAAISNQSTALWIGRHSQYDFGTFKGAIDEVRLFDRALSAAEVAADYAGSTSSSSSGSSSSGSSSSSSSSSSATSTSSSSASSASSATSSSGGTSTGSATSTGTSTSTSSAAGTTAGSSTSSAAGTSRGSTGSSGATASGSSSASASSGTSTGTSGPASSSGTGGTTPGKSGCGCSTDGGADGFLALLGLLAFCGQRRRVE